MSQLIKPITDMFDFNSNLTSLALGDLKNEDAVHRVKDGSGSSISYLTGHLLSSRYGMLKLVGAGEENPYADLFGREAGSRDGSEYPDISEFKSAWDALTPRFSAALGALTDDQVLAEPPSQYPVEDNTVRGALMFLAWHESYHVGQIGIMRTERGYPSIQARLYEQFAAAAK